MPKAVDKVPSMPLAPRLKKGRIPVLFGVQKNSTSRTGILLAINSGVCGGKIWESNQAVLPSNSWVILSIFRSTDDRTLASASHHLCRYEPSSSRVSLLQEDGFMEVNCEMEESRVKPVPTNL